MFKLFRLKWKKELEEMASLHRIAMAEKEAEIERLRKDLTQDHDLKVKEVTALLKLQSEQMIAKVRSEAQDEVLRIKEQVMKEGYDKLSIATQKLHEEGNLTTKFVQDLALNMMKKAPTSQVKVVTKQLKASNE